jgi:hypothetical protein
MVLQRSLLACFLLLSCSNAFAQLENGAIVGAVWDSERHPVAGVKVTASSASLVDRSITELTDSDGRYRFPALPPGVYELKAELPGFITVVRKEVRVFVGSTITVDFQMEIESVTETVEVSGAPPLIDATSSAVQQTVPTESVERLPKFSSVLDLIKLTPGVGDLDLAAYGAAGEAANAYWYDGVDIRSPASGHFVVLPSYNWIEEVQVIGLGAPAEYSGFTGVTGNFVTRSGGNEFRGLVESFFSNESLVSENIPNSAPQDTFKLVDTSVQLGGPILRNKFWFFTGFQYFYDQREPFGFPDSVTQKLPQFFTKLTYKINPDNTLQGSAYYDHLSIENDFADATFLPEAAANSNGRGAWSWNGTWLSVLSPQTYLEARFGGYDNGGFNVLPKNGNTPGHFDLATGIYSVNFPESDRLVRQRVQVNASVSHYTDHFLGQHDFKFGVEVERSRSDTLYQYNGNLFYYDYDGLPYQRYAWDGPYDLNDSIHRTSTFAQDSWKPIDRLTLNLGVRWDHIRGITALQTIPLDPVAPRLGFTYDIKGDGKTILKAHYGRYYDGFFDGYLHLFNVIPAKTLQMFDSGKWIDLFTNRPLNSLDPDLKQTYIRQFIASVDQEFPHEIVLGVRYIYRRWKNIIDNQNVSGRYAGVPFFNPITQEMITVFNRIDQGDTEFVITNPPDLFRKYDGFEITCEKRFSRNLFLSGSIVISKAKGNIDNVDSSKRAADPVFNDPNFNINIDGTLVNDPTYQTKIFGGYQFPWGINSSFFFRHESGDTWTPLIRVGGLNQGNVNIFGLSRGSNRFPSRNILDLRAEKAFSIHNGQLRFTADIFNVFNTAYVLNVNRVFGRPNFEQPTAFTSPREIRLGLRYTF